MPIIQKIRVNDPLNLILESKGDKDVIKACKETYDEVHVNQTWIE